MRRPRTITAACMALGLSAAANAELVSLQAVADATLYESATGNAANGAGQYLFAGRTNQNLARRALLRFDVATTLPQGVEIVSARLVLHVSQANGGNRNVSLHRVTTAWTTGASDPDLTESTGAAPLAGDATWLHASFDPFGASALWQNAGGDFLAAASAVTLTTTAGLQTWESAGLLADVRAFAAQGGANLGWILLGDESAAGTARRFDSADSAALGGIVPRLEIEYTTVPAPGSIALLALAGIVLRRRRR
ncbi:MAG: DNRLRE domain-containing protein [Phycisphaerales bacterium]